LKIAKKCIVIEECTSTQNSTNLPNWRTCINLANN
jgi:hypothetical protein